MDSGPKIPTDKAVSEEFMANSIVHNLKGVDPKASILDTSFGTLDHSNSPLAKQSAQYLLSSSLRRSAKIAWCFSCNLLDASLDLLMVPAKAFFPCFEANLVKRNETTIHLRHTGKSHDILSASSQPEL